MSKELWPRLEDLRLSINVVSDPDCLSLSDAGYRALMHLVRFSSTGLVWTYTSPGDGSIPDDDGILARICGLSICKWKKVRPEVAVFFRICKGKWHLTRDWVSVDDHPIRYAIPKAVQEQVRTREGKVCTYCATTVGPFDFDHILPVSRGGSNDPSNLTLACASCNRSKGGQTLSEWMAKKTKNSAPLMRCI